MKNKSLLALLLFWRISLFALGSIAGLFLSYKPSFPYAKVYLLNQNVPIWFASWANFDGVHYLTIITKGYLGTGLIQAFFPLYPMIISALTFFPIQPITIGLLISNISFIGFAFVFYNYVAKQFSPSVAKWAIIALILFPTSFFFGAFYTESLFLLLVVSSVWSAQDKKWFLAAILAALASSTRLVGVFLFPALLLELVQQNAQVKTPIYTQLSNLRLYKNILLTKYKEIAIISISLLGLLSYMLYLQITFNDPLYFFHVQSEFGGGREESIVLLPQVIWRYLKIFATYRPFDLKFIIFIQEFILTGLAYLGILFAAKKVRWSWTLFALLAITLPTITGTFSSMPRYVLAALPLFVLAGINLSKKSILWRVGLLISLLFLCFNTILFIQGYWVA